MIFKDKKTNKYGFRTYIFDVKKGKKIQKTRKGFTTKNAAQRAEYLFLVKNENIEVLEAINKSKNIKYLTLYNEYLEHENIRLKNSVFYALKPSLDKHIYKPFKGCKINSIDKNKVDIWYTELDKANYSYNYKNKLLRNLKQILQLAKIKYKYDNDFMNLYPPFKNKKIQKEMKKQIYTLIDFNKYIEATSDIDKKVFFSVLFFTGLRLGEIRAITWNDYNQKNKTISIRRAVNRTSGKSEITTLKTSNSVRDVIIPDVLVEMLNNYKEHKKNILGFNNQWYIFGDFTFLSETTIRRWNTEISKRANIEKIKIHNFRHSYITMMVNAKIDPKILQLQVGHSSIMTTLDIYTHIENEQKKEQVVSAFSKIFKNEK